MSRPRRDRRSYSDAEAGAVLGISERTVRNWRSRGWLVSRSSDGTLDAAATRSRVNANRDPTLGGKADRGIGGAAPVQPVVPGPPLSAPQPPPRMPSRYPEGGFGSGSDASRLLQARALRETLAGKALRLSLEQREGRLIDRREAERAYVECITEARARLEALPVRLGARLVGLDARAIQVMLRDEIEAALRTVRGVPAVGTGEGGAT